MKRFSLDEYLKNPSKKVITRDGRNARIIFTDAKNNYPIVALIEMPNGREMLPRGYKKDGTYLIGEKLSCDLFFAPEKKEGWVNIYKYNSKITTGSLVFNTKERAELAKGNRSDYIATIKIEWEE